MGSRNKRDRQSLRRQGEELAAHNELDAIMREALGERPPLSIDPDYGRVNTSDEDLYDRPLPFVWTFDGPDDSGPAYEEPLYDDEPDDFLEYDCGMMPNGQCLKAGSEECDWDCPRSRSAPEGEPLYDDEEEEARHQLLYVQTRKD